MIDGALPVRGPGQPTRRCPGCGNWLVDGGDGIWAHAIGIEPCLQSAWIVDVVTAAITTSINGHTPVVHDDAREAARRALGALLRIDALKSPPGVGPPPPPPRACRKCKTARPFHETCLQCGWCQQCSGAFGDHFESEQTDAD